MPSPPSSSSPTALMSTMTSTVVATALAAATPMAESSPTIVTAAADIFHAAVTSSSAPRMSASSSLKASTFGAAAWELVRGYSGLFSYLGSKWAMATFFISVVVNRTHFYASSRRNLHLGWRTRLLLYITPLLYLAHYTFVNLQTLQCQTSPTYRAMRYETADSRKTFVFGAEGGRLHALVSTLMFWQSAGASCSARDMVAVGDDLSNVMGSFSILWPTFVSFCFGHFVDTLASALQGRPRATEAGMTLFELSLAFAESEAMIAHAIGLGFFSSSAPKSNVDDVSPGLLLSRSMILQRLNVPTEVLLISVISCFDNLTSTILAITGHRSRFRLVNSGVWALCYMAAFVWSFSRLLASLSRPDELGIFRMPTVCIIGFVPHMLTLLAIVICIVIYATALAVTTLSPPPGTPADATLRQRFRLAFDNLQANVHFYSPSSSVRINWHDDFYKTLFKVGFQVLSAASEAVYLNKGSAIRVQSMTWLEAKRMRDLGVEVERRKKFYAVPSALVDDPIERSQTRGEYMVVSGYGRERRSTASDESTVAVASNNDNDDGVGVSERRSRWQLTRQFLGAVLALLSELWTSLIVSVVPLWILTWLPRRLTGRILEVDVRRSRQSELPPFADDDGIVIHRELQVDVEHELRRWIRLHCEAVDERRIDSTLYSWWKRGGWWGDQDESGEYTVSRADLDDDATSVVSTASGWDSSSVHEDDSDDDDADAGRRTPTQRDFRRDESSVEPTDRDPEALDLAAVARLLDPRTAAEREEALILAAHLRSSSSDRPVTRGQMRRRALQDKTRLLVGSSDSRTAGVGGNCSSTGTADLSLATGVEEEDALEEFLLERREEVRRRHSTRARDADGEGDGNGSSGPMCVVCQTEPRTIVVWPCGCLSVCDDCRVGVATRNYHNCLCCRTNVAAYSRLYVP